MSKPPNLPLLACCLALGFAPPPAAAGGASVDFTGSSWSGSASVGVQIPGARTLAGAASLDLDFGPQSDPLLAGDEFLLVLDYGIDQLPITGSWSVDEKGRALLMLDPSALAEELQDLLVHVCEERRGLHACALFFDLFHDLDVVVDAADFRSKLKAKSKKGIETLRVRGTLPFELVFLGEGSLRRVTIVFKGGDVVRD